MAKIPDATALGARPTPTDTAPLGNTAVAGQGIQQGTALFTAGANRAAADSASVAQFANQIAEAGAKYQSGQEAVARAKDLGAYSEAGFNEYLRLQTEGDLSDPKAIAGYLDFLNKKMQDTLDNHNGGDLSKSALTARLLAQKYDLSEKATTYGHALQTKLINDADERDISSLAAAAATDPSSMPKQFQALEDVANDRAPARGIHGTNAFLEAGKSQIVKSTLSKLIDQQQYDAVDKIIASTPQIDQMLKPEDRRAIDQRVIAGRIVKHKAEEAGQLKLNEFEQIVGRPPSAMERLKLAGVAPPQGPVPLSQKIAETEKVLQRPLKPDEIEKMAGISNADNAFGGGVTGAALSMFVNDTPAFENGLLPPEKERAYLAAVTQYSQPQTFIDPVTQNVVTRRPELPPFVQQALSNRGMSAPTPQGTPIGGAQPAGGGASSGFAGGGDFAGQTAPGRVPQAAPQPAAQANTPTGKTIWDMSPDISGAVPAMARGIARTPFIGELAPSPQMSQAPNYVSIVQRNLTTALQNSPRYAEGERRAIENEINIAPETFDNPVAFKNRLIGIDDALAVRERNAQKTGADPSLPLIERQHALAVRNAIEQFRHSLGVPPILTPEQAKTAPSGTMYRTTDGRVLVR